MAKFDRCAMCDYTYEDGSVIANVGPRAYGKVRLQYGQMLCDACNGSVGAVMEDYARDDAAKEAENERVSSQVKTT